MKNIKSNSKLEMICFDVGIGDCIFATCDGKSLLVDGGCWYVDSVKKYFSENNIKKIDYIVCTHLHTDHIAGLVELLNDIEFDEFFCNTDDLSASIYLNKINELLLKRNKIIHIPSLYENRMLGQAVMEFIGPDSEKKYEDENNYSLQIRLSLGKKSILLMGDALNEAMSDLLLRQRNIKAEIIKIPHHGFFEMNQNFLQEVSPAYAIISYAKNRIGKLSEELLELLKKENVQTFRTDLCGDIYCCIQNDKVYCKRKYEMSQLIGKRLLILGANAESISIVKTARQMGIYTIVTDNIIDSPAKKIADKYFDIDGNDVEELAHIVEMEKIDGVLIGCADPLVSAYVLLCKKVGLPCYVQENIVDFFTDKKIFKKICEEVGLPVIKNIFTGEYYDQYLHEKIEFPVIVKPVKCRGGKGVYLCNNLSEIGKAFVKAKDYSDNDEVIIEEYFDCEEVTISYMFYNGVPHFIGLMDKLVFRKKNEISPVTYGSLSPSKYTSTFIENWYQKFYELLRTIKIHNGLLYIQMFVKDGEFYPYDPSAILNAELTSAIYPKVYQLNIIQHFIEFALTGNMQVRTLFEEDGKVPCNKLTASIWILLNPGRIQTIYGRELLENSPNVQDYVWRLHEGTVITEKMAQTEKAVLARVWIAADSEQELKNEIDYIRSGISVLDNFGNDLVIR